MAQACLFERLGGSPAIGAAAELFCRKVLTDPLLPHYFDDADMDRQVAQQAASLTMALGGPNNYTGTDLRTAHVGPIGHLAATLRELGVTAADVAERDVAERDVADADVADADVADAGGIAASVRKDVLNR